MYILTLKKCHINHRWDGVYNKKCLLDTHTIKELEPAVHFYIHTSVCRRKGLGFCALLQLAFQKLSSFFAVCLFRL